MNKATASIAIALIGFTLGAVTPAAALATEGPFYKVGGKRLASGESQEISGKAAKSFVLTAPSAKIVITCSQLKYEKAKLLGSTGANAGSSEQTLKLESCETSGNGSSCALEGKAITITPLMAFEDWRFIGRTSVILFLFDPINKNPVLAKLVFVGTGCTTKETSLEGSLIGEAFSSGKPIEAGSEPAETTVNEVNLPAEPLKTSFVEKEGKLEERKAGLKAFGAAVKLEGQAEISLAGKGKWGLFTK